MKLEDQVCSLQLSKRLKELGVNQESLFVWEFYDDQCYGIKFIPYAIIPDEMNKFQLYSAFTVAEFGEMFPNNTQPLTYWTMKISTSIPEHLWTSDILFANKSLRIFYAESEANLRAKMLIYLLENNLMELPLKKYI